MDALSKIAAHKRAETERKKRRLPASDLRRLVSDAPKARGFAKALTSGKGARLICEVKRASPSKGVLIPKQSPLDFSAVALATDYEAGGAAALSVLTDVTFFWGSDDALVACRDAVRIPVLRKDFVLESYQVDESRYLGADAILLIARMLEPGHMMELAAQAQSLGMDVLVELHDEQELEAALALPGVLLGVNHRNLDTMTIDRERAIRLLPRIPAGRVVVAESGIRDANDVAELMRAGIHCFLVGESVATAPSPKDAVRALVSA